MSTKTTHPTAIKALLDPDLASLAREIAMDIQDVTTILDARGMGPSDLERLKADPTFSRYLQDAVVAWNGAGSTADRIRLKSLAMVEESLPSLHEASVDEKIPLNQRVEALKFTARLGGMMNERGEAAGGRDPASGFAITINIGGDTVKITQAPEVIDADVE